MEEGQILGLSVLAGMLLLLLRRRIGGELTIDIWLCHPVPLSAKQFVNKNVSKICLI